MWNINNYLATKKQSVIYWSKISALALTLLPGMIRFLRGDKTPWSGEAWTKASLKDKVLVVGGLLCFLALNYYAAYYTLSSVFWPARLSLGNWLLLVPGGAVSLLGMRELGRLLEKKEI